MATTTQDRATRELESAMMQGGDAAIGITQRVFGELTELSIGTAKENARLMAEVQAAAIDALRESQTAVLRWPVLWPEALTDPWHVYRKAFAETVDATQRALALTGTNTRLVAQSIERLQAMTTDTGRRLRETLASGPATREAPRRA